MKTIFTSLSLGIVLFLGVFSTASATVYSTNSYPYMYDNYNYYTTSYVAPVTQSSYTYTNGCYTYYYNGYTRQTSVVSYNCTTNYSYPTYSYPQYQYQTYYTEPQTYTYYVAPSTPYQTYRYNRDFGGWYPGNYVISNNTTSNNCYWSGGYQVCY